MSLLGLILVLQMGGVRIILRVSITRYNFDWIQILLRTDGLVRMQMAVVLVVVPVLRIVTIVNDIGLLLILSSLLLWKLLCQRLLFVLLLPIHHYRAVVWHHLDAIPVRRFRTFRRVVRHCAV